MRATCVVRGPALRALVMPNAELSTPNAMTDAGVARSVRSGQLTDADPPRPHVLWVPGTGYWVPGGSRRRQAIRRYRDDSR